MGRNGQRDEVNKVLQQLFERRQQSHISPFLLALVYAGLCAKDETFKYLEEAFEQRTGWMYGSARIDRSTLYAKTSATAIC